MPRAATIEDLPDDLLEAVFAKLELHERQRAIPLVCWHWNEVVHSRDLLDWLVIKLDCSDMPGEDCVRKAQSLRDWLVERAGPHVWRLHLAVSLPVPDDRDSFFQSGLDEEDEEAWDDAFGSALAACDEVTELALSLNYSFILDDIIGGMTQLEALSVAATGGNAILILEPLEELRSLVHLDFREVQCLHFGAAAAQHALPPSVTSLVVSRDETNIDDFGGDGEDGWKGMPPQIGMLPRLERLSVIGCLYDQNGCQPLQHISNTLTQLRWISAYPPNNLHCLTALRSLTLGDLEGYCMEELDVNYLEQALPEMASLTQLVLNKTTRLPANLAALQQLRSLCIVYVEGEDHLPDGGWLRSVRRLAASSTLLAASLPNLGTADGLQDVGVFVYDDELDIEPNLQSIVDWAGQQQQLQRLLIDHPSEAAAAAAAAGAAPLPPHLGLQHGHDYVHSTLFPTDVRDDTYGFDFAPE